MKPTQEAAKEILDRCLALFGKKTEDYGTAWRILRLPSITDQIYIKAQRIRSIQEKGVQLVGDPIADEFVGIINYGLMALIQIALQQDSRLELPTDEAIGAYKQHADNTLALMARKNHDYGEAWRLMRVSSITDIILMKLLRVKQIEDHQGQTLVSEGVDANYQDMINYSIFALILMEEGSQSRISAEGKGLQLTDFSFAKTRSLLAGKDVRLSDAVIEERRSYQ